jgi:heat shock protein HslJ
MRKFLALAISAAAMLAMLATACGETKADDATTTAPPASMPALSTRSLVNTSWVLVSYGDPANLKPVVAGSKITLVFNATSDHASGNGGVNGYGADFKRTDNQITVTGIIHTEMASVNQAINEQENAYFQLLQASQSIEFGNNSLTIHCQGGQLLNFSPA